MNRKCPTDTIKKIISMKNVKYIDFECQHLYSQNVKKYFAYFST